MLTVRYERLGLQPGDRILDLGAGFGRHAFEAAKRGAVVVAFDYADNELKEVRNTFGAMCEAGDDSFDRIVISEVLEHIQHDVDAIAEMTRVLKPGGVLAATVPTWLPEKINWMLSDEYHAPKSVGGHVRIYTATELKAKLRSAGLHVQGQHHAHALHSPYWWLKCAVGPRNDDHPLVARYRKFLEWDIISAPRSTRLADKVLSPVLGKSLVLYASKPARP